MAEYEDVRKIVDGGVKKADEALEATAAVVEKRGWTKYLVAALVVLVAGLVGWCFLR